MNRSPLGNSSFVAKHLKPRVKSKGTFLIGSLTPYFNNVAKSIYKPLNIWTNQLLTSNNKNSRILPSLTGTSQSSRQLLHVNRLYLLHVQGVTL